MSEPSSPRARIGNLIVGGSPLVAGVLLILLCGHTLHVARDTATWPSTSGTITQSEFIPGSHGMTADTTRFEYRYTVGVTAYKGEKISWGDTRSSGWSLYTAGQNVVVFFNPDQPEQAVLQTGTDRWTYVQLGVGFLLSLSGLGILLLPSLLAPPSGTSAA